MIDVTKMNGSKVTINSDLIETVEENPDTVLTLTTGKTPCPELSRRNSRVSAICACHIFYQIP